MVSVCRFCSFSKVRRMDNGGLYNAQQHMQGVSCSHEHSYMFLELRSFSRMRPSNGSLARLRSPSTYADLVVYREERH